MYSFVEDFKRVFVNYEMLFNKRLDEYTTFKVGGPAKIMIFPKSTIEFGLIIKYCNEHRIPFKIIGKGSNILVRDGGYNGVVIFTSKLNDININDDIIMVECGASLAKLCQKAINENLSGLEWAIGIPGSVGGAVYMNAGCFNHSFSEIVHNIECIDVFNNIYNFQIQDCGFSYRDSLFMHKDLYITKIFIKLNKSNEDLKSRANEIVSKRNLNQPKGKSAGSVFKNPKEHSAGLLIDKAGLKGKRINDAVVSEKHGNFIINLGNAKARDIEQLIEIIQKKVYKKYNIVLHTEIEIIGENNENNSRLSYT